MQIAMKDEDSSAASERVFHLHGADRLLYQNDHEGSWVGWQ